MMTLDEFFAEAKRLKCRMLPDDTADVRAILDAKDAKIESLQAQLNALQALERVPMTTADMVNVVKAAGWPTDTNDRQLIAAFNLIEATEAHHGITPPESKG